MEFYIKKGATLPTLKYRVIKDGRSDYHRFYNYVNTDKVFFSMYDYITKVPKILSKKGKFVASEIEDEFYILYKFRNFDTNKVGRFEGQFLIKTDEGSITLPLKEKIYINVIDTIIPDLLENDGCYTSDNPCCPIPSFTPTKSPLVPNISLYVDYEPGSIVISYYLYTSLALSQNLTLSFTHILEFNDNTTTVLNPQVTISSGLLSGQTITTLLSNNFNNLKYINNIINVTTNIPGLIINLEIYPNFPTPTPTPTNTITPTLSVTPTATQTPTNTITPTPTNTETPTPTQTPTNTITPTPTNTETPTPTQTPTNTETPTPTNTETPTPTNTETPTPTQTPTNTETPTPTNTETPTPTNTETPTPTNTETPTPTQTPTNTETPTNTPTNTPTTTPSPTPIPNLLISLDSGNINSYPTTGNTWFDLQGGNNNATLINSPTFSTGYTGILSFDNASSEYATINDIGDLNQWTVEVWFRLSTSLTGIVSSLVTNQYNGVSKLNFSIGTNNSPITYNLVVGFFDGSWHNTTGFVPAINTWYQVVGTYDGSVIRQYVNGVASGGTVNYVGTPQSGGEIRLMRRWDATVGVGNLVDGDLAIVKIYDVAITSGQVLQNYNDNALRFA